MQLPSSLYIFLSAQMHSSPALTCTNSTMEVQVLGSTIIPQANPSSDPDEIPFTIFDRYAPSFHVSVIFAFSPPTPPNSAMVDGLAKTLVHFPTLTGRLGRSWRDNQPCVLVGGRGGGALVVEAAVPSKLADHLPIEPRPELERLHPAWKDVEGPITLLQVQLSRFKCGGLVIGVTADHRVADGQSMSTFFIAWGQAVRGAPISPLPVHDKSWLEPRSPPRCEFDHRGFEFMPISPNRNYGYPTSSTTTDPGNITNMLLHYSPEFIATKLKPQVKEKYTSFELLLAHIWRKITMARGLDRKSSTMARISVNGRSRLKPAVPNEFFGNLVLTAYPSANVKGLIEGGLAGAARIIREGILYIGDGYFRSFIDFGAIHEREDLVRVDDDASANVMLPHLEADSLLGFRFQELDFGGGGDLCAFLLSWVPLDGVLVFLPSLQKDGGIDVFVGLLKEHARVLKQISHSLD